MSRNEWVPSDAAAELKAQSRIFSYTGCEIWICGDNVIVDAQWPLPDLTVREFARPRVYFQERCYCVAEGTPMACRASGGRVRRGRSPT